MSRPDAAPAPDEASAASPGPLSTPAPGGAPPVAARDSDRSLRLPPFPLPWPALVGALVLGTITAAAVVGAPAGVQYPVAAAVVAAVAVTVARRRPRPVRRMSWVLGGLAVGLAAVPAVSDSTPVIVLSLVAAAAATALAVTESRTWLHTVASPIVMLMGIVLAVPWAGRRVRRTSRSRALPPGALRGALIGGVVLVLVGWLLVGADVAFASLVGLAVPDVDLGTVPGRLVAGAAAAWAALAVAHVVAAPPWEDRPPRPRGQGPMAEWAVPLAVAAVLLGLFVAVQVVELMDPGALLEGSATPAGRARQGFGQLLAVTVLLVVLLAWAGRRSDPGNGRHRGVFASLGGAVVVLVAAVSATALGRMVEYQDEFGWTVLRILVAAFEVWLALLLIVVSLLWWRRRVDLVPPVVAAAAAAGMLVLGLARPEALAAEANVARFAETSRLDMAYLASLSADAVPAVMDLPRRERCEVLAEMADRASGNLVDPPLEAAVPADPWFAVNASRAPAREALTGQVC